MANFTETPNWESVELLYAPPGEDEPIDTDDVTTGSTNHANVFNRRLQSLVNRTRFVYNLLTSGRLNELINLASVNNKYVGFDGSGNMIASEISIPAVPDYYMVGQLILIPYTVTGTPYVDSRGYNWFIPTGNTLDPVITAYEPFYKAVWADIPPLLFSGGKGASADDDWIAGKIINYPDLRDKYIHAFSATRPLNTDFGSRSVTLNPENYRHKHNLSVRGVVPAVINGQNAFNYSTAGGGYGLIAYSEGGNDYPFNPSPTNIVGDRITEGDLLGAIWENTATAAAPVTINPPGFSVTPLIYTGTKT